ncbi:hypothetical protein [Azospirillum sp.]|uniref:hypothetical protein n=1 Tax=Azospirillum sp. TaxID=34012 RepID=UPI002D222CB3|nr:hypothetical protein [Azospirillum sp.]HYD69564.1 hypothetical protein [Azospirillum sp.]
MRRRAAACALVMAMLGACQQTAAVKEQAAALTLAPESLGQRQMQTRRFDTADERAILAAAAGVLQDLGFTTEETTASAGLIVGSKDRDAVEAGQVAGQVFFALLVAAMGGRADPVWDANQKIRLSVVTKPTADRSGIVVRATFQRVIWNTKNQVSRVETISAPEIYQQFFDRLSQSVFLEAHQI